MRNINKIMQLYMTKFKKKFAKNTRIKSSFLPIWLNHSLPLQRQKTLLYMALLFLFDHPDIEIERKIRNLVDL